MTLYNREQAARRAEASTKNVKGTCQLWTRTQFNAPSAGDVDGDGDSDAIDGWKKEPLSKRHADRTPPRGVPVAFKNKSGNGHGHRAISLGGGKIRSTDMQGNTYHPGTVGTSTIAGLEKAMGLIYLGWSETIDGVEIPPATRGKMIDGAIRATGVAISDTKKALASTKVPAKKTMLADALKSLEVGLAKLKKLPYV